jgi:hypothetical protein
MPEPSTDAIAASLLLQVPPDTASLKVVVAARHTDDEPVIADGNALMVTTAVTVLPDTV